MDTSKLPHGVRIAFTLSHVLDLADSMAAIKNSVATKLAERLLAPTPAKYCTPSGSE